MQRVDTSMWRARARSGWRRLRVAWRNRQERKIVIGLGLVTLASCGTGGVVAAWTRACTGTCPSAETVADFAPRQASQVLDARGTLLGTFHRERRTVVPIKSLPRSTLRDSRRAAPHSLSKHAGVPPAAPRSHPAGCTEGSMEAVTGSRLRRRGGTIGGGFARYAVASGN